METIPELYNIDGLQYFTFPLSFNLIDRCKWEDPFLLEKIKCRKYQNGYFCGGHNTLELIKYKDKIVIPQKLQDT